jgi:hypothetical protein
MRRVGNGFSLDFGPPVEPGFDIGKPSAFEQRTSNQNNNKSAQLFPTKPLIAGLLPDLSGSVHSLKEDSGAASVRFAFYLGEHRSLPGLDCEAVLSPDMGTDA